tara:strand:+ start:2388 stop:2861 length:474 start_codon:yes stop_codon:yes gene_type:complete
MDTFRRARSYFTWKFLFVIVTIVLLIAAIVYVYKNYLVPKMNPVYTPNKEFSTEENDDKEAELIIFTVDWCPYCKKAMPIWDKFKQAYEGKKINGYTLYFSTINCTDENDSEVKDMLNKYNIDGYPTIKLVKDGEVISYDAKVDDDTLQKFLQTVLQ